MSSIAHLAVVAALPTATHPVQHRRIFELQQGRVLGGNPVAYASERGLRLFLKEYKCSRVDLGVTTRYLEDDSRSCGSILIEVSGECGTPESCPNMHAEQRPRPILLLAG